MTRLESDLVVAEPAGPGNCEQAQGPRTDHGDALALSRVGQPQRMPGDRGRLHNGRVTNVEGEWQRDQTGGGRTELLSHSAVSGHAECALAMRLAEVVLAAPTGFTLHAPVDGLHHDSRAVFADTGELVAQDLPTPEGDIAQVGATGAGRPHLKQGSGAGRLVEIDDRHTSFDAAHGLTIPPPSPLQNGTVSGPNGQRRRGRNASRISDPRARVDRSPGMGATSRFTSR
jgi:hypothetical protein